MCVLVKVILPSLLCNKNPFKKSKMQTEAIRTEIPPPKKKKKNTKKREIIKFTNSQNTKRTNGQSSKQLFPKRWQLSNPNRTKNFKVAISASLMYFLLLNCFLLGQFLIMLSWNKNRKQLNIGRNSTFTSIFSRFVIYLLPAAKATIISDKSCYAYEISCDFCSCLLGRCYPPQRSFF